MLEGSIYTISHISTKTLATTANIESKYIHTIYVLEKQWFSFSCTLLWYSQQ